MADEFQKNKKVSSNLRISPPDDEDEETYMYAHRKRAAYLNDDENSVFDVRKQTGINTEKSVFDKGSIFRTS